MILKAKNIKKSYGSLQILKGIDLDIMKGEILSITGKSGTGKSTLLHILGTLDSPDSGSVLIEDTDTSRLSGKKLAQFRNEKVGFVFQFHHLLAEFTALENVCIPAFIKGESRSKSFARGRELLSYLGLTDRLDHKPSQMSGGEQQRVAIARALVNQPSVIFADEPTGNLDNQTSEELHQLILQLRKDFQQTFVIVTHNLELADLSDRILEMSEGKLHPQK